MEGPRKCVHVVAAVVNLQADKANSCHDSRSAFSEAADAAIATCRLWDSTGFVVALFEEGLAPTGCFAR
ncbi:hypothetical protein PR003_g2941 [Phytophthora rubi]|uniref:Uncharacterized protein n=1 Tax=Phytophthora rubi TaxID=129364 RepID=A0A6A4G535_9STRA|nr:hypothetical protein PR002_g559 [Phytophthora rubi]KAE9355255.1 hypothetical protein PR003_g2941 [Phytophthora rubi]